MISKTCLICNKEFFVKPYRKDKVKFCSQKCFGISMKGIHPKTEIKNGQHLSYKTEFTKETFKGVFGKNHPAFGKHWKLSDKNKENQSNAQKGIKRSYACPPHYKGKNHWNWQGGLTPLNKSLRQSEEYKEWQQSVYKKDKWTCRMCNKHCHEDIIAHHILDFHKFPDQRYLIDNGIVLCRKCHINLHRLTETNRQ